MKDLVAILTHSISTFLFFRPSLSVPQLEPASEMHTSQSSGTITPGVVMRGNNGANSNTHYTVQETVDEQLDGPVNLFQCPVLSVCGKEHSRLEVIYLRVSGILTCVFVFSPNLISSSSTTNRMAVESSLGSDLER